MAQVYDFNGTVLSSTACELGEGPSYDEATGTLWWFSIVEKKLFELDLASNTQTTHDLPFMASVLAPVDSDRQLIATENGLFFRDRRSGAFTPHCDVEADKPGNRSNDGRLHPSGALWLGTMGRKAEQGAGSIYHIAQGQVTTLFAGISIPNSICFSPDGAIGYYVDTKVNHMMRVALDPKTGLPVGEPQLFVDGTGEDGGIDGSICDAEGHVWNARWGAGAVDRYAPDGTRLARYRLGAKQTSCPVFLGDGRLAITSAWEGMDDAQRQADPHAGCLFEIAVPAASGPVPVYLA